MNYGLLLLTLLPLLLGVPFAYADQKGVRTSSACAPLLSRPGVLQGIPYQSSEAAPAAYLNLLSLVLEGIDEIAADTFGHADRSQIKVQLLNKLMIARTPINPLDEFQTGNQSLVPDDFTRPATPPNLTNFSPKLSTLADSGQFEALIENLTAADWATICQGIEQKLATIKNLQNAQAVAKPVTREDFIDAQDLNGEVRLHRIMRDGSLDEIRRVIAAPNLPLRYLNTRNKNNKTPLELFFLRFKNPQVFGRIPSLLDTDFYNPQALDYLFSDAEIRALFLEMRKKGFLSMQELENVDLKLDEAIRKHNLSTIRDLYEVGADVTKAVVSAITHLAVKELKLLIELGADVNATTSNEKPIFIALDIPDQDKITRKEIVKILIAAGTNPATTNISQFSPFAVAVLNRQVELLDLLPPLDKDINTIYPRLGGESESCLHMAVRLENLEIVQYLYDHGAEINLKNEKGFTPLHFATAHAFHPHVSKPIIKLLLKLGADPKALSKSLQTPFAVGTIAGQLVLSEVLSEGP